MILSSGNAVDDVSGETLAVQVVDLGRAGIGVPGQVLDGVERHVLAVQILTTRIRKEWGENLQQPSGIELALKDLLHGER